MPTERRLAAILFTDIVGSTAVTARSESAGLALRDRHRELVRTRVERCHGRVIEAVGDESLSTFESAVDAVGAALAIQRELRGDSELQVRIGIHLGETIFRGEEVFGDGVNIAARVRERAEPGQILVSSEVARAVQNQPDVYTASRGEHALKGVDQAVHVYAVSDTPTQATSPPATSRSEPNAGRWVATAGVVVLLAVAAVAWWLNTPLPTGAPLTAIAVLPFDDMSPGGDQAWLANGLAEELIESLSRIEELKVIARNSTVAMRGKDVRVVGDQLDVGAVVEGSVRRSGDQLRVTAQLIRVDDGSHLWSARHDRELADVFAIQREVAREVAEAIRTELGVSQTKSWLIESRYSTPDVRSWELLKKADERENTFTEQGFRDMIALTGQALEIDSEYAQAHAQHGWGYLNLWEFGFDPRDETLAQARASAERALEFEPTNGSAHNLLAWLSMKSCDWEGAETRLVRALKATPSHGPLRHAYGWLLLYTGRLEEAAPYFQKAVELDPAAAWTHFALSKLHLLGGDYGAAIREMEGISFSGPSDPLSLADAHHLNGDDDRAAEVLIQAYARSPEVGAAWEAAFVQGGLVAVYRAVLDHQVAQSGKPCTHNPARASTILAVVQESDRMVQCLEEGVRLKRPALWAKVDPAFDPYRDDPRFTALLRRMNLVE